MPSARLCWILWVACAAPVFADLRAGAAAVKITPPLGLPLAGYYSPRGAQGVHDDLYARALVLELEGSRAALVVCDLISLPRDIVEQARRRVSETVGLPPERVMLSATHTHTGPALAGRTRRDDVAAQSSEAARRYRAELPERIAESVRLAASRLEPARLWAAVGQVQSLAFNRRYVMKDGSVAWNPGKLNPNIVRPAGPVDPSLPVLYLDTPAGRPLATLVNFAMHLDTVGGSEYSADYPFTLASLLGKIKGPEMVTLFTLGAAGNVNHLDVRTRDRQKGHEEAARIGTVLAGETLKCYAGLRLLRPSALAARSRIVELPLAPADPSEAEWARRTAATFGKPDAAPFMDLVRAFKLLDVIERRGRPIAAEVQVIALAPELAWVGLPGEIFVELGLAVKHASPFGLTIVQSLTNDSIGYVPNRQAYAEGAYEVVSARCAEGSGEMLVAAALDLLKPPVR